MAESNNPYMIVIFFLYGLSFFLLGISISLQSRKGSEFKFGAYLWLLAMFGIIHGCNEWLDMFLMLGKSYWAQSSTQAMEIMRFFAGMISFIFLFLFALCIIFLNKRALQWLLPASIFCLSLFIGTLFIYGLVSGFSKQWSFTSDILMRYCLGFPSASLTAFAFLKQKTADEIRSLNTPSINSWLTGSAVLFGLFAVLDGLIVKEAPFFPASIFNYEDFIRTAGFPVQIFRALCAGGIFYYILRIINIFEMERKFKLENAYKEIIRISTREHERVGQDIHDGLCQELTGILLNEKVLEKRLDGLGLPEAAQLKKIAELTDQTISHARALSKSLYPVAIEEHGLVHALRDFADTVEEIYTINCRLEIDAGITIKDHAVANHLFRITREAINNAVRHGRANTVTISLHREADDKMVLAIRDNGSGITLPLDYSSGMGLQIMNYRAKMIDGTLEISRHRQGGTQVVCIFRPGEEKNGNSPE
jgi:signal transduction histidine kinase